MRRLIAILNCQQKKAWAQAQRDTWVKDVVSRGYADVRFFLGDGCTVEHPDEVLVNVPDDYTGIPLKVQAICRWAVERCYDIVHKADDDIYVVPERYITLPVERDYVGRFRTPYGSVYPVHFASGFFYSLSSRAAQLVADAQWNTDWMDERWVSSILARWGIGGYHDTVNYLATGPHLAAPAILSADPYRKGTVFCEYGPRDLYAMHTAMRRLTPVLHHAGLVAQPLGVVTDEILAAKPGDHIPWHKPNRRYNAGTDIR